MPRSRFSTCSSSSRDTIVNQTVQESLAKVSLLIDNTADLTNPASLSPRRASNNLPLQMQSSSVSGKRPADDPDSSHRIVRAKPSPNNTVDTESWSVIERDLGASIQSIRLRPAFRRQERRVRFEGNDDGSKTNADSDNLVVDDGKDSSTLETSKRSSNLFVTNSPDSEVSDDPMTGLDVSIARTCPTSNNNNVIAIANVNIDIARLAAETMSAVLAGAGSQFADSAPYVKIPVDDWILV